MRNAAKELLTIRMTADYSKGTVVSKTVNQAWDFPTTFARVGNQFLVLNSQLNKRTANQPPTLPFTVVSAPIPAAQPTALPSTGAAPDSAWPTLLALGAVLAALGLARRYRLS